MVFKKDLTPIGPRGKVLKRKGKGATEQRTAPRERETLTGDNTFARAMNRYPKPAPAPVASSPMTMPTGMGLPSEEI